MTERTTSLLEKITLHANSKAFSFSLQSYGIFIYVVSWNCALLIEETRGSTSSGSRHAFLGRLRIAHPRLHGKTIRTLPTSVWQSEPIRSRVFAEQHVLLLLATAAVPLRSGPRTSRCLLPPCPVTQVFAVYMPAGASCVPGLLVSGCWRLLKRLPKTRRASRPFRLEPIWREHSPNAAAR